MILPYLIYIIIMIIGVILAICTINIYTEGLTWSSIFKFLNATIKLDELAKQSNYYRNFNKEQRDNFLKDSQEVFDSFEGMPRMLWEEYDVTYSKLIDIYKSIRMLKWQEQSK